MERSSRQGQADYHTRAGLQCDTHNRQIRGASQNSSPGCNGKIDSTSSNADSDCDSVSRTTRAARVCYSNAESDADWYRRRWWCRRGSDQHGRRRYSNADVDHCNTHADATIFHSEHGGGLDTYAHADATKFPSGLVSDSSNTYAHADATKFHSDHDRPDTGAKRYDDSAARRCIVYF